MKTPKIAETEKPEDERREPVVTITASENRRRAGRRFPKGVAVEVAASEFSEGEWKAIALDPVLKITPPID